MFIDKKYYYIINGKNKNIETYNIINFNYIGIRQTNINLNMN